ncbi:hypothetical protein ACL02S_17295 [Nocardia sp. 004]|uniref:hypothetical protein n=1 Tax=Nocardia sp. 004 TaxID=3385978 RepID=UPI0039A2C0DD
MLMDVPAVQGLARDLRGSAMTVNDAAVRVAGCVREFDPMGAGRDYRAQGDRLGRGLEEVRRYLFTWANCVHDCGEALEASANSYRDVDQSAASNLGAVTGAFE